MPQPLSDAVFVITGASSGMGRSAARAARGEALVPYPLPGSRSLEQPKDFGTVREAGGTEWHGLE